jgi:hypothetical protein
MPRTHQAGKAVAAHSTTHTGTGRSQNKVEDRTRNRQCSSQQNAQQQHGMQNNSAQNQLVLPDA